MQRGAHDRIGNRRPRVRVWGGVREAGTPRASRSFISYSDSAPRRRPYTCTNFRHSVLVVTRGGAKRRCCGGGGVPGSARATPGGDAETSARRTCWRPRLRLCLVPGLPEEAWHGCFEGSLVW